jgi:hypothetical protein
LNTLRYSNLRNAENTKYKRLTRNLVWYRWLL